MLRGVDVSHWNGHINFLEFTKDLYSDFMIAKATQGVSYQDPTIQYNMDMCREFSILHGMYHYVDARPANEQALNFLSSVSVHGDIETVLALDIEDSSLTRLGRQGTGKLVKDMIEVVHDETGRYPLLYMSRDFMAKNFYEQGKLCAGWIAAWGVKGYKASRVGGDVNRSIHQFTSNGHVCGISTDVDLNHAFMTREAWLRIARPSRS